MNVSFGFIRIFIEFFDEFHVFYLDVSFLNVS